MSRQISIGSALTIAALALLQGCGGSGGRPGSAPPAAPQPPTLSALADLSFDQDTTSPALTFRVDDADTPVAQLELAIATSDAALLPLRGVQVEGAGNERSLRLSPAAETTGSATLTITVRDPGGLTATRTLNVRVNPVLVAFSNVARSAFDARVGDAAARVAGVTVTADVDDDAMAFDALLQSGSP